MDGSWWKTLLKWDDLGVPPFSETSIKALIYMTYMIKLFTMTINITNVYIYMTKIDQIVYYDYDIVTITSSIFMDQNIWSFQVVSGHKSPPNQDPSASAPSKTPKAGTACLWEVHLENLECVSKNRVFFSPNHP